MEQSPLPQEVIVALNGETKSFAFKGRREYPSVMSWGMVGFGIFWTGFISIFWIVFLGPIFAGKEVHFKLNGVPTTAGIGHLGPLMFPAVFIGLFTLVGFFLLWNGVKMMVAEGPWFVGTATRLIIWSPKKFRTIDWKNFSGDIMVNGGTDNADITLSLSSGHMESRKNGPSQYVADKVYMCGVRNALSIEEICRKRIKGD